MDPELEQRDIDRHYSSGYSNPYLAYQYPQNPYMYGSGYSGGSDRFFDFKHKHEYYSHDSHGGGGKKHKKSAALSALTLLAFLFFLNLLQSCLKEQMLAMNPTVMVLTASAQRNDGIIAQQRSDEKYDSEKKNITGIEDKLESYEIYVKTLEPPASEKLDKKRTKKKIRRKQNQDIIHKSTTTISPKLTNYYLRDYYS